MAHNFTGPEDYIRDYRSYIEHERPDRFLDSARLDLKNLQKAIDMLPKNTADPELIRYMDIIMQLVRQMNQARQAAEGSARSVNFYITVLVREIGRCKNNMDAIERDLQVLRSQRNRVTYQESITRYAEQFRKASKQRQLADEVYVALRAAIREAESRQYDFDVDARGAKASAPEGARPAEEKGAAAGAGPSADEREALRRHYESITREPGAPVPGAMPPELPAAGPRPGVASAIIPQQPKPINYKM